MAKSDRGIFLDHEIKPQSVCIYTDLDLLNFCHRQEIFCQSNPILFPLSYNSHLKNIEETY